MSKCHIVQVRNNLIESIIPNALMNGIVHLHVNISELIFTLNNDMNIFILEDFCIHIW